MNRSQLLKLSKNTFSEEKYLTIEKDLNKFEKKLIHYFGDDLDLNKIQFSSILINTENLAISCKISNKEIVKFPNKYSVDDFCSYWGDEIGLYLIFEKTIKCGMYCLTIYDSIELYRARAGHQTYSCQKWHNQFDLLFNKLDTIKQTKLLESLTKFHLKHGLKNKNLPESVKPILLLS